MVLSKKVSIGAGGIHGHCWFAGEDISAGEMLWELGSMVYHDVDITKEELMQWDEAKREKFLSLAYMVREGVYRGSDPENKDIPLEEQYEYYVNHSCDGNAWYVGNDLLVAKRDIKKGEEICYDYALTESDPDWILAPQCLCGKALCRGKVTGNDWKLPQLQQKYGDHFEPHVLQLIQNHKQSQQ
jgi:SET domain-containing protein